MVSELGRRGQGVGVGGLDQSALLPFLALPLQPTRRLLLPPSFPSRPSTSRTPTSHSMDGLLLHSILISPRAERRTGPLLCPWSYRCFPVSPFVPLKRERPIVGVKRSLRVRERGRVRVCGRRGV